MSGPGPAGIAAAFEAACRAELSALKPGNVHIFAAGHGMEVAQFEQAARAAAPAIAALGRAVGARIEAAVAASLAVAGCNTNLGIVLLAAPLAAATLAGPAVDPGATPLLSSAALPGGLRARLAGVLAGLDVADAQAAFRAIAAASPGGLGAAREGDVREAATISLSQAMALAAGRDMIARQYANAFAEVFTVGVPELAGAPCAPDRVEAAYLAFLSTFPDSHIARKFGPPTAEAVRAEADAVRRSLAGLEPAARRAALSAFDASLKARGLNPGTSADLTVASIFAALLQGDAGG
ncbi:triphosphoribosyl-dephospho-CoA synthase [Xanthobacter sp. AM11]|uniref:triphosphoribosyl-dephospho-CoA synthase n=1 Tax=Xanthobacter sp. AM11 TaxID=3380643 RepID=UPI0039BEF800